MRKKELKLIITFKTTADAMAMEQLCKKSRSEGRLIPVPRAITAGCGMAWCANIDCREDLVRLMQKAKLQEEAIHECFV